MGRNRAEGWQYAKVSGHAYEATYCDLVLSDPGVAGDLVTVARRLGARGEPVGCVVSAATKAEDLWGGKTTRKRDVTATLSDGSGIGVSVKKPSTASPQVQLTKLDGFLRWVDFQLGRPPKEVIWALKAFTGNTGGQRITEFAPGVSLTSRKSKKHGDTQWEAYQNRLNPARGTYRRSGKCCLGGSVRTWGQSRALCSRPGTANARMTTRRSSTAE
jgi:hypothetical protein